MWRRRRGEKKYANPFKAAIRQRAPVSYWAIFWVIILGVVFYFLLFFRPWWGIKTIRVNGNYPVEPERLQEIVRNFLRQNYIAPGWHYLFFSPKSFIKELESKLPLDKVEIKKDFKQKTVDVKISGREYVGYWISRGLAFKIDKNGIITGLADFDQLDAPEIKIYDFDNKLVSDINIQALDKKALNFISGFYQQESVKKYEPKHWEASMTNRRLALVVKEGWRIFFDYNGEIKSQLESLDRVLNQAIPQADRQKIDYIDVRFGEKVYYRLK
ncbi:MAG: hypothetical protein Q8M83_05615 [bacterium]|nr:hypothetical protein [bacterium]